MYQGNQAEWSEGLPLLDGAELWAAAEWCDDRDRMDRLTRPKTQCQGSTVTAQRPHY